MRILNNSGTLVLQNFFEGAITDFVIEQRAGDVFLNLTFRRKNNGIFKKIQVKDLPTAQNLVEQLSEVFQNFDNQAVIDMRY